MFSLFPPTATEKKRSCIQIRYITKASIVFKVKVEMQSATNTAVFLVITEGIISKKDGICTSPCLNTPQVSQTESEIAIKFVLKIKIYS